MSTAFDDEAGATGVASSRLPGRHTWSASAIDAALAELASHSREWVQLDTGARIDIVDQILSAFTVNMEEWVRVSVEAKGFRIRTFEEAEEWLCAATIARALRVLRRSLTELQRDGRPAIPGAVHHGPDGQLILDVVPHDTWDRLLYRGYRASVWMERGIDREAMLATQADVYRREDVAPKVALMLGAGNASMLPVVDTLHKLLVEKQVVLLKLNPVNDYLGPLIEHFMAPLVRRGFLRVIYGGEEAGAYLTRHEGVDELHMTGSAATYEAIAFGTGDESIRRKRAHQPLVDKRFTAELGNISPVIIVPGPWSDADLREQAQQISTWMVANAGFACLAPRLLVQHRNWSLRGKLLDAIDQVLRAVPTRNAYYPGASRTHAMFMDAHPVDRFYGESEPGHLPWTLVTDVDPEAADDICFNVEPFCGIMSETALDAADTVQFIERAVQFVNERVWGSLCATVIVHPASGADTEVAAAIERAVGALRYGTVTVNSGTFAGYFFGTTPWGAFPGHPPWNIQSGTGKTVNLLMLQGAQKSVVRGSFTKWPDPIRVTARTAHKTLRELAYLEATRSLPGLIRLLWSLRPATR